MLLTSVKIVRLAKNIALIRFFIVIFMIGLSAVESCGLIPSGQESIRRFTVTGFTLAPAMAYTAEPSVTALVPSISGSMEAARNFIRNLIMQTIENVLEEQGRNALLSDAAITIILQQLNVTIDYNPLSCNKAFTVPMANMQGNYDAAKMMNCFVISDVVISICTMMDCVHPTMHVVPVPAEFRTFSGSLKTTNVIMANWSSQMWQSVLNRVYQRLASSSFRKYFSSATVTIN